jgi:hypothetical protein
MIIINGMSVVVALAVWSICSTINDKKKDDQEMRKINSQAHNHGYGLYSEREDSLSDGYWNKK